MKEIGRGGGDRTHDLRHKRAFHANISESISAFPAVSYKDTIPGVVAS